MYAGNPGVKVLHAGAEDESADLGNLADSVILFVKAALTYLVSVDIGREVAHEVDLSCRVVLHQAPVLDPLHDVVAAPLAGILS